MTLRIRSVGIVQTAKTLAALYALIGIIAGIAIFFFTLFGPARTASGGMVSAIFALILIPVCYAIFGFIGVAIAAWVYNFVANKTGGVEFTTTTVSEVISPG